MRTRVLRPAVVWTGHVWVLVVDEQPRATSSRATWTTELTAADWAAAGFEGDAGTFTLTFEDGVVKVTDPTARSATGPLLRLPRDRW